MPPAGWAACTPNAELFSYSALDSTNRVDYLRSSAYTYLDGRGHCFDASEAATEGSLVIKPIGQNQLEVIHIAGHGEFTIRRPYQVSGALAACEAFDVEGQQITSPVCNDAGAETRIQPEEKAVRYLLRFGDK